MYLDCNAKLQLTPNMITITDQLVSKASYILTVGMRLKEG